jgi:hypothetical protein
MHCQTGQLLAKGTDFHSYAHINVRNPLYENEFVINI